MPAVIAHAAPPHLPLSLDVAGVVLGVGAIVFVVVAYDLFRNQRSGGE